MINGVTKIIMTKSDVLDAFEDLSVCTSYGMDGKPQKMVPYQMTKQPIEPHYEHFKGWMTDITKIRSYDGLPAPMKHYVDFINGFLGVHVSHISNGPERDQIISI
jgi:adenylosuccinate synthase